MRNVKTVIYFTLISLVFTSCDDDDLNAPNNPNRPTKPIMADYFPDNTANYWIYDTYAVDTLGSERYIQTDSIIVSDTIINNLSYKHYRSTTNRGFGRVFRKVIRDSSGYMVNTNGQVLFTLNEFDTVIRIDSIPNYGVNTARMRAEINPILTPIGSFENVINYELTFTFINKPLNLPRTRVADNIYTRDIGMVFSTYFYAAAPGRYEQRLMRYSVK